MDYYLKWWQLGQGLTLDLGLLIAIYQINNTTMSNTHEWVMTDPSCNQMMKKIRENVFLFKEDRIINPETKETRTFESEIDLNDYSQTEMFESVKSFGYSFNEMCTWIDEGKNLDLIAECIFEMEIE